MVRSLGEVPDFASLVKDVDAAAGVCLVADLARVNQLRCLFDRHAPGFGQHSATTVDLFFGERRIAKFDAEKAALDNAAREEAQNAVFMVLPSLHGAQDVAVVEFAEPLEDVRIGQEMCAIEGFVKENAQGGRREQRHSMAGQILCPPQNEHQHVFGGQDRAVQVDLPIHQPTGHDELLDGVDALFFDDDLVFSHIEHLDDAVAAHFAFCDAGIKAVSAEVVQAVHVELGRDKCMEKTPGVVVIEDANGQIQPPPKCLIHPAHHQGGDVLVVNAADNAVLQGVREGAVTNVVQ